MATSSKSRQQVQTSDGPPGQQTEAQTQPDERQPERASDHQEREWPNPERPSAGARAANGSESAEAQPRQAPAAGGAPGQRPREERILDAAAALLVRWGYRKTTIDDVAREAGVGKGTIYLHWKDKNELFLAAILRAQQQVGEEVMQRIAADPEGGRFHRLWTHGMMGSLSNPLAAALLKGNAEVFQGLAGAFDPGMLRQLMGDYEAYIVQLQQAGLIRADVPVSVISFITGALKVGVISTPDVFHQEQNPSMEQLTDAISDMLRRWLEPEHLPNDTTVGKQLVTEWWKKVQEVENQQQ